MTHTKTFTRKEILIIGLLFFLAGYFVRDVARVVVPATQATVAGMDWSVLRHDYDFKKAVRKVVERSCEVDGKSLSC